MLTADYLRARLDYDPKTGVFTWKPTGTPRWDSRYAGTRAGAVKTDGARHIRIDRRYYLEHRLAWLHTHGIWPLQLIDHVNGRADDNRMQNLREATKSQNAMNSRARGRWPKGVYRTQRGKFLAQIKKRGKHTYLGVFDNPTEAAEAYARKATEIFGEFACVHR